MPRPFPKKISQIKPTLTNLAQTSHYLIEFGGLSGPLRQHLKLRGMDSRFITETTGLLCNRAVLPGSSFATADIVGNYMGVAEKMAHTRTFVQMDLEFYVDNKYNSLKFLEHWIEFIASGSSTTYNGDGADPVDKGYYFRMRYPNEYKCDETRIIKFERDYKRYIEYRFFGLFPISLNSTTVSYEGSNILRASASFNYDRYIAGKSYSYDIFKGQDNNKNDIPSYSEGVVTNAFDRPLNLSFGEAMNIDIFGGSTSFSQQALGNYSQFVGSGSNYFGSNASTLSDSQIRRSFIGERLI